MVALLITLALVCAVGYVVFWIGGKLAEPAKAVVQVIGILGVVVWVLVHMRELIHAIASGAP